MFTWFDWTWRIAVTVVAAMVVWKFWVWWRPDPPTTYLRTDLINAQQSETMFTGFATVAMLKLDVDGQGLVPIHQVRESDPELIETNIDGYCYRLFEISIGYSSLRSSLDIAESLVEQDPVARLPAPELLTANIIDARHGGKVTQLRCDRTNQVDSDGSNSQRLRMLAEILIADGQWSSHVDNGRNVLASFSETLTEAQKTVVKNRVNVLEESRETLRSLSPEGMADWRAKLRRGLAEPTISTHPDASSSGPPSTGIPQLDAALAASERPGPMSGTLNLNQILGRSLDSERVRLAQAGGYLGSLNLTFSTIGIFGQQRGRWFWKSNDFYIRQDLADASYGSDFTLDAIRTTGLFGPKRLEVTLPEPKLLAIDRRTTFVAAKPKDFRRKDENNKDTGDGSEIEEAMSSNLAAQLARVSPQAIRFARATLTSQIHALVAADVDEVRVRYSPLESPQVRQFADLVRLMQEAQPSWAQGLLEEVTE